MRIGPRKLVIAAVVLAAASVPAILSASGSNVLRGSAASATGTTAVSGQDQIDYFQTTGNSGTYIQFVSGTTGKITKESVTSGGGCATPSPSGNPLINFSGLLYATNDYSGGTTPVVAGAYKQRTGVCSLSQAWSIDNVQVGTAPQTGAEGLDFTLLPQSGQTMNSLVAGRIMSQAVIQLQRSDKLSGAVTVSLVEYLQGGPVASQCYSIPNSTVYQADSSVTSCAGSTAATTGFDTIEIRVLTPGGSVSVVGPDSVFWLANQICGGQTLQTSSSSDATLGQVTFTVTLIAASTVCKSYTGFFANQSSTDGVIKNAEFDSFGSNNVHFSYSLDWGNVPECSPDGNGGLGACPPTTVSYLDPTTGANVSGANQTYCAQASSTNPDQPLCTTSRDYSYVTTPSGTRTHITETWDGLLDPTFRVG